MTRDISNSEDILDVRDITDRFEELEAERAALTDALENANEAAAEPMQDDDDEEDRKAAVTNAELALEEWTNDCDTGEQFAAIKQLLDDLEGNGGDHQWRGSWYPVTLIRDSYFVDAMEELVQDTGDLPRDIPGYLVIDWEATADNLRADYSSVDFDGQTYWYR